MAVSLTNALRAEYKRLFETCEIRPGRRGAVDTITGNILSNKDRYVGAGKPLGIPWYFIGFVHSLESSLSFKKHLHNGDPLTARTVQVPAGRPAAGAPPFTWEVSAADSLAFQRLDRVTDWSLAGTLFQLEKYNGFGYRSRTPVIPSPYLWSFSNHYTKGKFVADGRFDENAVSQQCGAVALLRRMAERQIVAFDAEGNPVAGSAPAPDADAEPFVTFSETIESDAARKLQRQLNTFPGIFLQVDGVPGSKTSDALKRATGHFLKGDPRLRAGVPE